MKMQTLVGLTVLAAHGLFGQSAAAPPAFDVASVKPSDPTSRRGSDLRVLPGGRFEVANLNLNVIVMEAFKVKGYQISGAPGWLNTDQFDIVAKSDGNPSRERMMEMVQTLLADRFKLKTRRESREGDVYALTVAKGGPKLQPPTGDRSVARNSFSHHGLLHANRTNQILQTLAATAQTQSAAAKVANDKLAAAEKLNTSYVSHVLRLALLAPDLVVAILDGRQPVTMQLQPLVRCVADDWCAQRRALL
jgi:uncharacterized protein (TIGR03435 family)